MFLLYLFMGSRKVKVREVGIEPTETEALLLAMAIGVFRAAAAAARKGRPSLRSHSPELPWARSFWLPVKVAYFVPVCKRAGLDFCCRVCITHLSVGGVSSYVTREGKAVKPYLLRGGRGSMRR